MSVQRTMILVWVLALVALMLIAGLQLHNKSPFEDGADISHATVHIGAATVDAEVADTIKLQTKGLSGRTNLPDGNGMLFVFNKEGAHDIWMKDMQFPIDILWADSTGTIITVEEHVSPNTYPQIFSASEPRALYVLEAPAGFASRYGIVEGDTMEISR